MTDKPIYAIAGFNDNIKGTVKFSEDLDNNQIKIDLNISGLTPNSLHGFHVHEAGDLTDKCTSMCAHFNPYGKTHGCPGLRERHVGDLGNIKTNNRGEAKYTFYDNVIKLRGTKCNIIGRGLIIHEDEEVIIQKPSKTEDALTPSKMFSFYKTGFTFAMDALKTIKGVKIQFVKLVPIDSNSEIASVMVGIDAKSNHIYNIIETGKNNTVTTLEIRSFKTNQPVSEKLFIFDVLKYRDQKKYSISEPK